MVAGALRDALQTRAIATARTHQLGRTLLVDRHDVRQAQLAARAQQVGRGRRGRGLAGLPVAPHRRHERRQRRGQRLALGRLGLGILHLRGTATHALLRRPPWSLPASACAAKGGALCPRAAAIHNLPQGSGEQPCGCASAPSAGSSQKRCAGWGAPCPTAAAAPRSWCAAAATPPPPFPDSPPPASTSGPQSAARTPAVCPARRRGAGVTRGTPQQASRVALAAGGLDYITTKRRRSMHAGSAGPRGAPFAFA
jgi:hypothetical protein